MPLPLENENAPSRWHEFGWLRWPGFVLILGVLFGLAWYHYTPLNRFPPDSLEALRSDTGAILYSIEPGPPGADSEGFHGYEILGQIRLDRPGDRDAIASALASATRGAWDESGCFNPRHGVRATGSSGVHDIVLCFECGRAQVYHPDSQRKFVRISRNAESLNQFLKSRGVKLPED